MDLLRLELLFRDKGLPEFGGLGGRLQRNGSSHRRTRCTGQINCSHGKMSVMIASAPEVKKEILNDTSA